VEMECVDSFQCVIAKTLQVGVADVLCLGEFAGNVGDRIVEAIDTEAAPHDCLAILEHIPGESDARLKIERRRPYTGVWNGGSVSVPGDTRQRIRGGVIRSSVEGGVPDGGADATRILPCAQLGDAGTEGDYQVRGDTPCVLAIEVRVPEVQICIWIEVLLMPILDLSFKEIGQGIAAVEVWFAIRGRAIRIRPVVIGKVV